MSPVDHGREVVRAADTKSAMLLALAGGGLALASTVADSRPPTPVAVPLLVAVGLLAVAVWLLLTVIRPRLDGGFGPVAGRADQSAELVWVRREAVRRHRLLQWAVDCLRGALLLAVLAGIVAVVVAV